jgi:hypothetical protein
VTSRAYVCELVWQCTVHTLCTNSSYLCTDSHAPPRAGTCTPIEWCAKMHHVSLNTYAWIHIQICWMCVAGYMYAPRGDSPPAAAATPLDKSTDIYATGNFQIHPRAFSVSSQHGASEGMSCVASIKVTGTQHGFECRPSGAPGARAATCLILHQTRSFQVRCTRNLVLLT